MKVFVLAMVTAAVLTGISVARAGTPVGPYDPNCPDNTGGKRVKAVAVDCSKSENQANPNCVKTNTDNPSGENIKH